MLSLTSYPAAEFIYKCDDFYHPEDEGSICWNESTIQVGWPQIDTPDLLSAKDQAASLFNREVAQCSTN
ncbi:MAG: dTDP-4-dehydrorhamnose 3,5-epimerase family protein [Clostridia bacterium]